jgi:hypothetical protein
MKIKRMSPGALLAELVVVVVGILLALGIEQSQAEKADRALETGYLAALQDDFENTLWWTAERGPWVNSDRERSALLIAEVLDADAPIRDSVTIAYSLVRLTAVPHLRVFEATMNELLATGNIRVIRSGVIRSQLVQFYDVAQTFQELERDVMSRAGDAKWALARHVNPAATATIAAHGWSDTDGPVWEEPLTVESAPESLRSAIAHSDFIDRLRADAEASQAISVMLADIYAIRSRLTRLADEARTVHRTLAAEVGNGTA